MAEYHINVFWSAEDASWIADVPDLPGCSATGATPEEAVKEVRVAQELWIEAAKEHGRSIPEPRYRPAIYTG
jgi:predicted RNase H-like HicB family nuclease